jgi:hypothetical protein
VYLDILEGSAVEELHLLLRLVDHNRKLWLRQQSRAFPTAKT